MSDKSGTDWAAVLRLARQANKQRRNQPADDFPGRSESMPLPAEPTDVLPGEDRVDVLAARVLAGEQLWHPLDENGNERTAALRAVILARRRMNGSTESLGYALDGRGGPGGGRLMLPFHRITELFPLIEGQEFDDLVDDVALHGVREPVWLWEGEVIDGRNRCRAHAIATQQEADKPEEMRRIVPPLPTRQWDGQGSLTAFVLSLNLRRRHLDESDRAMLGAVAADMIEEEAFQRQKAGLKRGAGPLVSKDTNGENRRNSPDSGRSRAKAAELVSVSEASVARAQKVRAKGTPELVQAVEQGKVKVSRASRLADLPAEQQVAEINRQKDKAKRTVAASRLRDALGGAGTDLDVARKRLEKAAKKLAGYDAKRTLGAIAKAQESLAIDAARLLAESGAA